METQHGKIEGDVEVDCDLEMFGMFTGDVTVKRGGLLILHGMANKSLVVEDGAVVEIHGTVVGHVINDGGRVSIDGRVSGRVARRAGETTISSEASVGSVCDQ